MGNRYASPLAAAAISVVAAACGSREAEPETPEPPSEVAETRELHIPDVDPERCDPEGKEEVTYDLNRDGRPNMSELYQTVDERGADVRVLACKRVDFDGDGNLDYVAVYDESGELIAEEFDLTFDGEFDVRTHYDPDSGEVFLAERRSGFGGGADIRELYDEDGALELVERDRSGDGNTDMWEQYEGGELVAILYDDTADGRVDRREEVSRDEDGAASAAADDDLADELEDEAPADELDDEAPSDELGPGDATMPESP